MGRARSTALLLLSSVGWSLTMTDRPQTITGRYAHVPNPCTTTPCLPGMAYALQAHGVQYVITVDGRWFAQRRSWEGYSPEPGELVTVTGPVHERRDVNGTPYLVIEAMTVQPAR